MTDILDETPGGELVRHEAAHESADPMQALMQRMAGELIASTALSRVEQQVGQTLREVREYNQNIHALNLALGEFKVRSIDPIRSELEYLRYNLGAKSEDVVTMMQKMVRALDDKLTALGMTPHEKTERGLISERPGLQDLTEKAIEPEAIMAAITDLHRRLDAMSQENPGPDQGPANV